MMKNKFLHKHRTICWECEWAAGKEEKCPWACRFEPVPGWKAKSTKVLVGEKHIDSFDVYECPLFEIMHEIKKGIVAKAGKMRMKREWHRFTEEEIATIKKLRFENEYSVKEISHVTGICESKIYSLTRKERNGAKK